MARASRPICLHSGAKEPSIALRSIIISTDHELGRRLTAALETTGQIEVDRTLDHYPTAIELVRTLHAVWTDAASLHPAAANLVAIARSSNGP